MSEIEPRSSDIAACLLLEGRLNIEKRHDDEREGWHMEDTYG